MPNSSTIVLVSALCFLSLLGFAFSDDKGSDIYVFGQIYCDSCRVGYINELSLMTGDAKVRMQCRDKEGKKITYKGSRRTNNVDGEFKFMLYPDQVDKDGSCVLIPVSPPMPNCTDIEPNYRQRVDNVRLGPGLSHQIYTEPIAFQPKKPLPQCAEFLKKEANKEALKHVQESKY